MESCSPRSLTQVPMSASAASSLIGFGAMPGAARGRPLPRPPLDANVMRDGLTVRYRLVQARTRWGVWNGRHWAYSIYLVFVGDDQTGSYRYQWEYWNGRSWVAV